MTLKELFEKYGSVWLGIGDERWFKPMGISTTGNNIIGEFRDGCSASYSVKDEAFSIYTESKKKVTKWLWATDYACLKSYPELIWGPSKNGVRLDLGYHSKEERARAVKTGTCQRLSKRQRTLTPEPFRDLLIKMVRDE